MNQKEKMVKLLMNLSNQCKKMNTELESLNKLIKDDDWIVHLKAINNVERTIAKWIELKEFL
jgi:hypothetical protein